jgi:GAF domain-containing protein
MALGTRRPPQTWLSALTLIKPPNEPLLPAEQKLLEDLAAQAGLVLRNFRLIEDLRARHGGDSSPRGPKSGGVWSGTSTMGHSSSS